MRNNKFPKNKVTYNGRYIPNYKNIQVPIDVRHFIWRDDYFLKEVLKTLNLSGKSNDEKVLEILRFVRKNIKYISDQESIGYSEFWQFPIETLKLCLLL